MRYRRLGKWGVKVSEVGLGSWLTFGGSVDEETSIACIRRAYELGVNFFDTANVYALGRAEEVVGKALAPFPRESYVLATKVFFPMGEGPNDRGLSRKHVFEQCHASLRRLGTDYIDLYQCHRFDPETPLEETCRAMDDLIRQGKILYWGTSEWGAEELSLAHLIAKTEGLHPPVSEQSQYSMLWRKPEQKVMPTARRLGMGILPWSPLAMGVLTGKYRSLREIPPDSRAARPGEAVFMRELLTEENLAKVERLRAVAAEAGLSLSRLALAWCLRRPEVSSVIVGATRPSHVEENVRASGVEITPELEVAIERALTPEPRG